MTKRLRAAKPKPGVLDVRWATPECGAAPDLVYTWGGGGADKADSRVLCDALERCAVFDGKSLRQVLTERGYDLATLRFSIRQNDKG